MCSIRLNGLTSVCVLWVGKIVVRMVKEGRGKAVGEVGLALKRKCHHESCGNINEEKSVKSEKEKKNVWIEIKTTAVLQEQRK